MSLQIIEAVFENGVLKPLTPLQHLLLEGQHVQIVLQIVPATTNLVQPENVIETAEDLINNSRVYNSVEEFRNSPEYKIYTPPKIGSGKGLLVHMADDFDAPLEDFKEYM